MRSAEIRGCWLALRCWSLAAGVVAIGAAQIPPAARVEAALAAEFRAQAARPVAAHRGALMKALEPLLVQQARHLASELRPWPGDAGASLLPLIRKTASSEDGIRPNAHTAKGLALLLRLLPPDAFPSGFSREAAGARAHAVLRYLLLTHGASGRTCDDGKAWRSQWQSAYWAALAGEASWLLWDRLSAEEKWLAARMIADEADRFVGVTPPAQRVRDTKAEENAWNSQIVSLACAMFPQHPRHALWRETAVRWIASSFPREADLSRADILDGRPLREWLSGANVHDDFTLENHQRVHPDYLACTYLLTSQVPMYAWGGLRPPEVLHLNVEGINRTLKRLALPDGSWLYPNGQDWGLRRHVDYLEYHVAMAVLYRDRQSATLARAALQTLNRMAARTPAGSILLPGEIKLSSDQAMALELPAHAYALMAQSGEGPEPVPFARLWDEMAGRHVFEAGRLGMLRTKRSIATFSWGQQVMGTIEPLGRDLLFSPETRGLIGHVSGQGLAREVPVVKRHVVAPVGEALGVVGVLERAGGAVEQRFGFLALPNDVVVYVDSLYLIGDTAPSVLHLGTLGVLNDVNWPYHDGVRTLAFEGGRREFAAASANNDAAADVESRWFNVDGFGIVRLAACGPARYDPRPTGAAGRLEQRFHLNAVPGDTLSGIRRGQQLAHGAYVFLPHQSPAETKDVAASIQLLTVPGASPIALRLTDGTRVVIDLEQLTLRVSPP